MDINNFHLKDLPKLQQVFSITEDKTLAEALSFLIKHNVYSAPVFSTDHHLRGLVSLDNLIAVIVQLFADKAESNNQHSNSAKISHHKYSQKDISDITHAFNEKVLKSSNVISECTLVDPSTKLADAIHLILDKKQRLLIGNDTTIENIISPFLLVKFLSSHKELPVFNQKLNESKVKVTSPVQSINCNHSTIYAFAKMVEGGFSGLAVIEEDKIITTLTFKDISHAVNDFNLLTESTEEYVKEVRQSKIETTIYPTINVSQTDTLGVVSQKFVAVKSHRVFVRRGETLFGIVSVSDILYGFI